MNIKQLRYFCKVVETGSASQAAKMLDLAPAAISMQISALEKELNGELFNRSSRPMTLTRLGEFIYQRAPEIIFNIEKLEKDAWQYVNSKSITLTLGFVRSVMFNLIPETIKYFADTHGHIEINLKEVLSEYQPELLLNHELDIGFTREMDNDNFIGHELNHELILVDPLIAAIPKNHYLSKKIHCVIFVTHRLSFSPAILKAVTHYGYLRNSMNTVFVLPFLIASLKFIRHWRW